MRSLALIVFCCVASIPSFAQGKPDSIPLLPDHYRARVAQFKKEPIVKEKVIFAGDGLIESGKWRKLLKDSSVINRGIKGDITPALLLRMGDIVNRQPSVFFLLIGADDLYKRLSDESVIENIFSIVTKIRKGSVTSKIVVISLLPVDPGHKNFPAGYEREGHVAAINAQLEKYAERLKFTYVDIHSAFVDGKGHLDAAYTTNGLDLNPAGYTHFAEVLKRKKIL